MDRTGAFSYVYAKTCGILSRAFVGKNVDSLFQIKKLSELWSFLFDEETPLIPEGMLAQKIEQKSQQAFISTFVNLLKAFDVPDSLSVTCLRKYDYNNLKQIVFALRNHEKQLPLIIDISPFSVLHTEKWPDLAAITADTSVSWLNKIPEIKDDSLWENRLDLQYYDDLWASTFLLPPEERHKVQDFVKEQIVVNNIVWALRLRVYFEMKPEEILPLLVYYEKRDEVFSLISKEKNNSKELIIPQELLTDKLAGFAVQTLKFPLDSYKEWEKWSYKKFLNPWKDSALWAVDPRWFELSTKKYFSKLSLKKFREEPFSVFSLYCFFVIKQYETALVRTATESICLNVSEKEINEFRGIR